MPQNLLAELLAKATAIGPEDGSVGYPQPPPSPPGYGFSMADKPPHLLPKVPVKDVREGVDPRRSFTGNYPAHIIRELVAGAKAKGLDPALVLAMGMQESGLGRMGGGVEAAGNPLMVSQVHSGRGPTSKWPSDTLLGGLDDSSVSRDARNALDREWSINTALEYLKSRLAKHPGNLEHAVQAYNGLGKPDGDQPMYGIEGRGNLPTDFYGKRVLDLRDNVVNKSPLLQEMMKRAK